MTEKLFQSGQAVTTTRRGFATGIGGWLVCQLMMKPGFACDDHEIAEKRIQSDYAILQADAAEGSGDQKNETEQFMADARVAWSYFSKANVLNRTLIASVAYLDNGRRAGYPVLTMWDIAGLINAHIAARMLRLISEEQLQTFAQRIVRVLSQAVVKFGDSVLPNIEVASTSSADIRMGFDSADTGRLLISLKLLDNMTRRKAAVEKLVRSWDLNHAIKDGTIRNLSGRRHEEFHINSYVRYYMRGYKLWGFDLKDPLDDLLPQLNDGNRAEFFMAAAKLCRYGTEPLVTYAVELGDHPEMQFLADMLYAAQIKRYKETGQLTAVSEGNLDIAPWFSYQSCEFDPLGTDVWHIDANKMEDRELITKLGEKVRTISIKGTYLWHATRSGSYSAALIDVARTKASDSKLGFHSNVYAGSMVPTNCADINTNALVLESIAYRLGGRIPLLAQSKKGMG